VFAPRQHSLRTARFAIAGERLIRREERGVYP
jgi:hypothetical protein